MQTRTMAIALVIGAASLAGAAPSRSPLQPIPAGRYVPLHGDARAGMHVKAFQLDRDPVTRRDFLAFVRTHPQWRRSRVIASNAASRDYLAEWKGDVDAGNATDLARPVTSVSWNAAKAFCAARGKRLPTLAEWEYAASAPRTDESAAAFAQRLTTQYALRSSTPAPVADAEANRFGVRGMHDRVWEWVADPNERIGHAHHTHGQEHDLSCAGAAIGASDPRNYAAFLRAAFRSALAESTSLPTLGFRCAV